MAEAGALIARAASARPGASALEAVMGEDWAVLKRHQPMRATQLEAVVARHAGRRGGFAGATVRVGGRLGAANRIVLAGRRPQAMVKLVARGGAANRAGLRAQLAYLSREGTVAVLRSERHLGAELDEAGAEALASAWSLRDAKGAIDRTSHFVVSFPEGTDAEAADRAGRAWAAEAFESGRLGDRWDYYTVHHHDTAYPHTHVVVSRRGLEADTWLKVSGRGAISYDRLRSLQVEVAGIEGIELEATSRLSRGIPERAIADGAYRAAFEEVREPEAPAVSTETALTAAAGVVAFAWQAEADAERVEARDPEAASALRQAAGRLSAGLALAPAERGRAALIEAASPAAWASLAELSAAWGELGAARDLSRSERAAFAGQLGALEREAVAALRGAVEPRERGGWSSASEGEEEPERASAARTGHRALEAPLALPDPVEDEAELPAPERAPRRGWRLRLPRWLGGGERDEVEGRRISRGQEPDDQREAARMAPERVEEGASRDADRPLTDGELARMAALRERLRELREREAREQEQRERDWQRDRSRGRDDGGYGL